jgi:hypothetical protein
MIRAYGTAYTKYIKLFPLTAAQHVNNTANAMIVMPTAEVALLLRCSLVYLFLAVFLWD